MRVAVSRDEAIATSRAAVVSELVEVGRVGKPHGLAGAFFVERASSDPARFAVGAQVLVERRARGGSRVEAVGRVGP